MTRTTIHLAALGLAAVAAFAGVASDVSAHRRGDGRGDGRDRFGLRGLIAAIGDAGTREFTASVRGREARVIVTEDAMIFRNGSPATFEDLAVGDHFRALGRPIARDPFVFEARALGAFDGTTIPGRRAHAEGAIASLDAAAMTFVLHNGRRGTDVTVAVGERTRIWKDGAEADFAALAVGDRALVRGLLESTDAGRVIRAILVRVATPGGGGGRRR